MRIVDSFSELLRHAYHCVQVVTYEKDGHVYNVAVECTDCNEVLFDYDNPEDISQSADDIVETRVIFKMTPEQKTASGVGLQDSDCIAFFLDCSANPGYVLSYMHMGQHAEASIEFMNDCIPALPEEYADLKRELESIGYRCVL